MLIEFHVVQDHGPSNMNRGQDGRPKTAIYAGTERLRISSQCWKRTLRQPKPADRRDAEPGVFEQTVGSSHFGVRTRLLPQLVFDALAKTDLAQEYHKGVRSFFQSAGQKKDSDDSSRSDDGKKKQKPKPGRSRQAIYFDPTAVPDLALAMSKAHKETHKSGKQAGQLMYAAVFEAFLDPKVLFTTEVDALLEDAGIDEADRKKITKASVQFVTERMRDAEREIARAHGDDDFGSEDESVRGLEDDEATDEVDLSDPDLPERFVAIAMLLMELQSKGEITKKELDSFFKSPAKDDKRYKVEVPPNYTKQRAKLLKFLGDTRSHLAADIALFGRMTTSDAFQDVEAACQVADSISTHPVVIETDYFTTVDDLDSGSGAAHVGESEIASAVFYQNLAVDYDALLRNLGAEVPKGKEDDETLQKIAAEAREIAPKTIEGLLRAIMHNVPSGKINSHAHNQQPSLILVEVKDKHLATNYLTAFHDPARNGEREDGSTETLLTDSVQKLLAFARYRDKKMKTEGTKRLLFANDEPTEDAIARLRQRLKGGQSSPLTDDEFFVNSNWTFAISA